MQRKTFLRITYVALTLVLLTLASTAWAVEYKAIYKFKGAADGSHPYAGLISDGGGNLYGTTWYGGDDGMGVVFKLIPNPDGSWTQTVLHSFGGPDGSEPMGNLIFDAVGNLYSTTSEGGTYGHGTVFRLSPNPDGSWTESVLHSFDGTDGARPTGALIFDAAGNLYGTTQRGSSYGTVFRLVPNPDGSWQEQVLYTFTGGVDGQYPSAGLVFDAAGNLYSTTVWGGAYGLGTVFKLTPNPDGSWTQTVIHSFTGSGGDTCYATLIFDTAGNLYGTTRYGGAYSRGTVFKLAPQPDGKWKRSKLHTFKGPDGADAGAGLTFDAAGALYGMTLHGGAYDSGTVFKLAPQPDGSWRFTKLHVFKNQHAPYGGPMMGADGLYGMTYNGGKGNGVVFKVTP